MKLTDHKPFNASQSLWEHCNLELSAWNSWAF